MTYLINLSRWLLVLTAPFVFVALVLKVRNGECTPMANTLVGKRG